MQRTVVVAGGGISGLSACYHLAKDGGLSKVILVEGSSRLGGWMHSTRTEDGAIFEHGPRAIRPAGVVGRNTLSLVSALGLENSILPVVGSNPASKNRYLYVNKSLHKLPSSLGGVLRTIPPFTEPLFLCGLRDFTAPRGSQEDESIHSFVTRRFGKELADIVIDSLCRGVFAGDSRSLSLRSCFPFLYQAERRKRSVILGMATGGAEKGPQVDSELIRRSKKERWSQWSLRGGMQALSEALEGFLRERGVEIHKDTPVRQLERTADNRWKVTLADGSITADHVFSALPAKALSQLLPTEAEPLARELRQMSTVTVAVVNLEYDGTIMPVMGFGHLIPSSEDSVILGIVYDSVAFPQHDRQGSKSTRVTVMMGGAWFESSLGPPESVSSEKLLHLATQAAATQLGATEKPSRAIIHLNKDCIPQYTLGHWKRLDSISTFINQHSLPFSLIGASYEGVSVNDCIYNARNAVQSLLGTQSAK
ncbi:protoporphyrinogen oxidase [Bombina bombina]|uniref:protoporphyrinogen oxidase n=1 Tax=Bombina bombina TaxID=8345 RepID=UPI00235B0E7A|nr:protoporphyrinogen oxidase [Bombina bombina]XP_053560462.1 protoporphyrinogen oxidase [Bombina bombina]